MSDAAKGDEFITPLQTTKNRKIVSRAVDICFVTVTCHVFLSRGSIDQSRDTSLRTVCVLCVMLNAISQSYLTPSRSFLFFCGAPISAI